MAFSDSILLSLIPIPNTHTYTHMRVHTHAHTHTHTHTYIYIYVCVCVFFDNETFVFPMISGLAMTKYLERHKLDKGVKSWIINILNGFETT